MLLLLLLDGSRSRIIIIIIIITVTHKGNDHTMKYIILYTANHKGILSMIGFLSYGCRTQQLGWSRTSHSPPRPNKVWQKNGREQATKSPAAINWGGAGWVRVVTLGRERKPTETEKPWRHRISQNRGLKHMGKHRDSLKQRSIFTWQHCRNLQQQGGSVRPSWATAFRVEKTALRWKSHQSLKTQRW